jgi:hypothetical protein
MFGDSLFKGSSRTWYHGRGRENLPFRPALQVDEEQEGLSLEAAQPLVTGAGLRVARPLPPMLRAPSLLPGLQQDASLSWHPPIRLVGCS